MVQACAVAVLSTYAGLPPLPLGRALAEDNLWGTATFRQRILSRLGVFVTLTAELHYLPAMGQVAEAVHARARKRWPEALDDVPLYPAFQ